MLRPSCQTHPKRCSAPTQTSSRRTTRCLCHHSPKATNRRVPSFNLPLLSQPGVATAPCKPGHLRGRPAYRRHSSALCHCPTRLLPRDAEELEPSWTCAKGRRRSNRQPPALRRGTTHSIPGCRSTSTIANTSSPALQAFRQKTWESVSFASTPTTARRIVEIQFSASGVGTRATRSATASSPLVLQPGGAGRLSQRSKSCRRCRRAPARCRRLLHPKLKGDIMLQVGDAAICPRGGGLHHPHLLRH